MDNLAEQKQEIEALESIYPVEWRKELGSDVSYSMTINSEVKLFVTLSPNYPSDESPEYELQAPRISSGTKHFIKTAFDEISQNNFGQPVLFQWIEKLREIIEKEVQKNTKVVSKKGETSEKSPTKSQNFEIIHGPIIEDRKSKFQGHVCKVKNENEVRAVMDILLGIKKIAQAKHNIRAYRIQREGGPLLKDCDEDGEAHACSPLMNLLDTLKVVDVLVIVSRWYGGIQLGPDRFKHYKNAARRALEEAGYIN